MTQYNVGRRRLDARPATRDFSVRPVALASAHTAKGRWPLATRPPAPGSVAAPTRVWGDVVRHLTCALLPGKMKGPARMKKTPSEKRNAARTPRKLQLSGSKPGGRDEPEAESCSGTTASCCRAGGPSPSPPPRTPNLSPCSARLFLRERAFPLSSHGFAMPISRSREAAHVAA